MSTLTLAVNDYFKPDLASQAEVGAVASPPVTPSTASCSHKSSHSPIFASEGSYTFAKSTPDLTLSARPGYTPFRSSPIDPVTVAPRLCPNPAVAVTAVHEATADVKAAVPAPSFASAALSSTPNDSPTKNSEESRAGSGTPPLRKLKSSLRLPKLTKLFSTSNLSPKLVRFASRLENVKMFDGRDSPSTVSLQNTPVGSPNSYNFNLNDYFSSHRNFTDLGLSDDMDSDSDSDSDTFTEYTKDKLYRVSSSNFSAPKNIYDKQSSAVYLQLMSVGADKTLLVLLVMCQNLAFEKQMSVKLTLNNWQSTLIYTNGQYVKSFSTVNFDQFRFTIPLSHLPSLVSAQFCIRYDVGGNTHWDNNSGRNYNVVLSSYVKPRRDLFAYKAPTFAPSQQNTSHHLQPSHHSPSHTPTISVEKPVEKPNTPPYNYDELISKLMTVTKNSEVPVLHHSASLPTLRPRYSQSFRLKQELPTKGEKAAKGEKAGKGAAASALAAQTTPLTLPKTNASPLRLYSIPPSKQSSAQSQQTPLAKFESVKPASFLDSKFNSSSYATLLQTYCFNGSSSGSSAVGSLANSRLNLSSSLCSDMTATPFTYGDLIHI